MSIMNEYLRYVENTEPPTIFHRWSLLTSIGALLERNLYYGDGYFTYYPNLYVMLMGESGTRKSTAINMAKNLLKQSGYHNFSAERTSKEKYLLDLGEQNEEPGPADSITNAALFGNSFVSQATDERTTPNYIVAGEFNDFIGNGNIEFMSVLGNLWDWSGGPYENKVKNGKSVKIPNPCISLLGGNTATGFSLAFPSSVIGQGFFSRLILIHAAATGKRIRRPVLPDINFATTLNEIKTRSVGKLRETSGADRLLEAIYTEFLPLPDSRFGSYSTRRYAQLMKLVIVICAMDLSADCVVNDEHVLLANTLLSHAEQSMPLALGEFGKARSSDVSHSLVQYIYSRGTQLTTMSDLWKHFAQDVDNGTGLSEMLMKMCSSGRIQTATINMGGTRVTGFLPNRKSIEEADGSSQYVDFSLLTTEEREMKK